MVFQEKLLEKAYFNVEMSDFWKAPLADSIKWRLIKNDHFRKQQPVPGVLTAKLKLPFIHVEYIKPFIKG